MKDDLQFLRLFDLYSPLLTATQREITELYFNYDLSLGEIAEQKGVSRQSVSDCLNKSKKLLEKYDQDKYPLRELKENGLTSVQGRSKATVQLMKYLKEHR